MKGCDDYSANIQLYFDKELSGQDVEEFRAHIEECPVCRTELKAEEELSGLLHRSRPFYSAPDALRKRVMQAAELFPSTTAHAPIRLCECIVKVLPLPLPSATRPPCPPLLAP